MALPDVTDLRAHLRLVTTAEDESLADALADAVATVETYIRQPIEARPVTFEVFPRFSGGSTFARRLVLPFAPIAEPVVVLPFENSSPLSEFLDYTVSTARGWITFAADHYFGDGSPEGQSHLVTATVGLSLLPDYASRVERVMRRAILLVASDFFLRRNPAAIYESSGGGAATTYAPGATENIPAPIRTLLDPFRRVLV